VNPNDYKLVPGNDPVIHTPTQEIDFNNPQIDPEVLANLLKEKMKEYGGLGLSANQLGIPYSAFAITFGDHSDVAFNPKIVSRSEETMDLEEGCLTYPGVYVKLPRSVQIRVRLTDINGATNTFTFTGLTARAIQHETQHILGQTFLRGISRLKIEMAIKKAKKLGYHYKYSDFYSKN
jgi:peptide deformylase